jgi:hypothetical protein
MGKLPLIAAVASALWALPACAGDGGGISSDPAVRLAQFELCIGPDCRDRDRRYHDRDDDDWRNGYADDWRYYRGGACRDVAIRERHGNEIVIRHIRRCD